MLAPAALALQPRHASLEHPALQEVPELALHELRRARTVARLHRRAQEGLQMLADHLIEHGALGVSRAIHGTTHGMSRGSAREEAPTAQRSIRRRPARA